MRVSCVQKRILIRKEKRKLDHQALIQECKPIHSKVHTELGPRVNKKASGINLCKLTIQL